MAPIADGSGVVELLDLYSIQEWHRKIMTNRRLKIDGRVIDDFSSVFVIAEIGHNHGGSVDVCQQMIDAAMKAGASSAKIQKRSNREIFTRDFYESAYASPNAYAPTYGEHREALEFNRSQIEALLSYAKSKNFIFFSTAFDEGSADLLAEAGVTAMKIASADLTNTPLLRHVAKMALPMIVSTGGADLIDVRRAFDTIMPHNQQLALLQCTAHYPPKPEEVNLRVIESFRKIFPEIVIGLSDHSIDDTTALASIALGARVIEKHFTLDRHAKGSDHSLSLDPSAMEAMVEKIKVITAALGDGIKRRYASENAGFLKMAKSLVARGDLAEGHVLTPEDVVARTPPQGLPPYAMDELLGRRLKQALKTDQPILHEHVGLRDGVEARR